MTISPNLIFRLILVFSWIILNPLYGQDLVKLRLTDVRITDINIGTYPKQDSVPRVNKNQPRTAEEPDTNFTYEKYSRFLSAIADTKKYIVLPINEFRKKIDNNKIVIGLRHDVDVNLDLAYQFSMEEWKLGFRSTYYILHTANYYLANPGNKAVHSESIIPILKTMQNDGHFEIGWHNDLVTLQVVYNINPFNFLKQELTWLRSNGINIYGSASHGSGYCHTYGYLNYYFFEECSSPAAIQYPNNITIPVGSKKVTLTKGKFSDFDLEYEAYFLNNNKYFSDASIVGGIRWNIGMLDLNSLKAGDRVIILLHPIHWHKASVDANFESFRIGGQKSSSINASTASITVEMPFGTNRSALLPSFTLSPGCYARVSNQTQVSGYTANNFDNPLTYTVYAENRDIHKEWKVFVNNAKNSACNFESFIIPDLTSSVSINSVNKTVLVKVKEMADLKHLPVQFKLSQGARAWIGFEEQFSNTGTMDFSAPIRYIILAEDGISASTWIVTVEKLQHCANFLSFSIPGLFEPVEIDTINNTIKAEISSNEPLNSLRASFELSAHARAYIGNKEQFSGISVNDYTQPLIFHIVSEDSLLIKQWSVTITPKSTHIKDIKSKPADLSLYPNPSEGIIHIQFHNVPDSPTILEVFNSLGEKIYSVQYSERGSFMKVIDLSRFPSGIFLVRCSQSDKPVILVIEHC
jgi:hypothetical protein